MTTYNFNEKCGTKNIKVSKNEKIQINYEQKSAHVDYVINREGNDIIIKCGDNGKDIIRLKDIANIAVNNVTFNYSYGEDEDRVEKTINISDEFFTTIIKMGNKLKSNNGITYVGNQLNEKIIATSKNDTIKSGGGKKNILYGGGGNDKLYGGKGEDLFLFGHGKSFTSNSDGSEECINELYDNKESYSVYKDGKNKIFNATAKDKIIFSDLTSDDIEFVRNGNNLSIINHDETIKDKVTLSGFFTSSSKLDKIYFADPSDGIDLDTVLDDTADSISIKDSANILYAGSGKMKGSEYSETIWGSSKKDNIYTGLGNDGVYAGAGNDTIRINGDGEKAVFFEGYNPITGKYQKEGNDKIYISKNAEGKYIDTTLVFDGITAPVTEEPSDIVPVSYKASTNGKDLIITHYYESDNTYVKNGTVTVKNYFSNYNETYLTENDDLGILIGDYESNLPQKVSDIIKNTGVLITGKTDSKNTIKGTFYNDTIVGGNKSDSIYTGKGNDIIEGKKGNDKIHLDGEGSKTVKFYRGSGNDKLFIDSESVNANILTNKSDAVVSASSNGKDVTFNFKYSKTLTDKFTITDAFNNENIVKIDNEKISNLLNAMNISITGTLNKKKNTYTFNGTKYNDIINGTSKKDIINAGEGNNIVNIGKKASANITAGSGNDIYNAKNLSAQVKISDAGGDDVLNISGVKVSDLNLFFDVTKDGEKGQDLYIVNNKNINLIASNKSVMPKAAIEIINYSGDGKVETITLNNTDISTKISSMISSITKDVKDFLSETKYTSAFELLNDKSRSAASLKKELCSIYKKYKADQEYGLMLGAPRHSADSSYIMSEVAAWQTQQNSFDGYPIIDNNQNENIQVLVAECINQ